MQVWAATFEGKVTATMIFDTDFGDAEDEEEEDDEEEEEDEKKIAFALSPSAEQLSDVEPPNFGKMLPYGRFLVSTPDFPRPFAFLPPSSLLFSHFLLFLLLCLLFF